MPQMQFPFFPEGVTHITSLLAFSAQEGRITYFNGEMPVFVHETSDIDSFRMITAQFCVNGNTRQVEIVRAFGISKISIKRAVKLYRGQGPKGFYAQRKTRGPAVLTPAVLQQAQQLLDEGQATPEVANRLGIKSDTLSKAVRAGRLHQRVKKDHSVASSTKSERSNNDSLAPMGMGASNVAARIAASVGELEEPVAPEFQPALDVPNGGVCVRCRRCWRWGC